MQNGYGYICWQVTEECRCLHSLAPDARHAVDLLIQTRSAVGVPDANPYVFARLSTNTPLSGNAELPEVVRECPGIKCPERITSTLLRRYITTVSQVCNFLAQAYNKLSYATAFISFVLYITCWEKND